MRGTHDLESPECNVTMCQLITDIGGIRPYPAEDRAESTL